MATRIHKHISIPYKHIFDIHTYMLAHTHRHTHALMHIVTGTCPRQFHNLGILVTVAMEIYVIMTMPINLRVKNAHLHECQHKILVNVHG